MKQILVNIQSFSEGCSSLKYVSGLSGEKTLEKSVVNADVVFLIE
jgi:hypothetical protein